MEELKIGDKCRIINYGHLIWENKSIQEEFKSNFPVYSEDDNFRYIDIRPEWIGKQVVIEGISDCGKKYKTSLFSWADRKQLQLINK